MNTRKKDFLDESIYQEKLDLHLKSKQSQLETILRVSMPHQLTNMKTILWINILFIGFSFHLLTKFDWTNTLLFFYITVLLTLCSILFALLQKRGKNYGDLEDINHSFNIPNTNIGKTSMISALLVNCDIGIKDNIKAMQYISKYMHFSTWMTLLSILFFTFALSTQIYMKGGNIDMAKTRVPPSKVVVKPPKSVTEASERSLNTPPPRPVPKPKPRG